MFHISTKKQNK